MATHHHRSRFPHKHASLAGGPLDLWNRWEIQILVLLSLALQVALLLLARIRRREASTIPRILLWQAYLLADSTAMYAVGQLSVGSSPQKRQLAAFWAPFLLLHLGGPDNISAYVLEDSKLWLRHLQNLVVQVLGVAYVLYKHLAGGDMFLLLAAVLVFAVGVVKYAERTWALKCGNLESIRSSLKKSSSLAKHHHHFAPLYHHVSIMPMVEASCDDGDESLLRRAHSMFHVCKHAMVDSWVNKDDAEKLRDLRREGYRTMWTVMEMELSLMYDILYTKAGVIYTWSGYCIRVVSPVAAAASLLLFQFSNSSESDDDNGHSTVDVAVTYTLLAGALLLETMSLLNALGSSWAYMCLCTTRWKWLRSAALCTGRWDRLRRFVREITGRGGCFKKSARRWSGKMGQFNLLYCCCCRRRRPNGILARKLGLGYNNESCGCSGTIDIPEDLKKELFRYVRELNRKGKTSLNAQGVIRKNWGEQALERHYKELYKRLKGSNLLGVEFQEGIIIWHIGTDVFLAKRSGADADANADADAAKLVKTIRMLSNYMMFLLVDRPYMLPGLAQSTLYRITRQKLEDMASVCSLHRNTCTWFKGLFCLHDDPDCTGRDELATTLYNNRPVYSPEAPRLSYANNVAEELLRQQRDKGSEPTLRLLRDVWIDFLVYASNRCSRESHAKKLSNGGELTTILWLMTNYLHQQDYAGEPEDASSVA